MDSDQLESIEKELGRAVIAPADLRANVMRTVHRRLVGERWERRLGRLAVAVLLVGVGLNWSVGWGDRTWQSAAGQIAARTSSQSIVEAAIAIGQSTDAETGSQIARHLAALSGTPLSSDQAAVIDREIRLRLKSARERKEGPS
jgi:hypothetical protein